MMLGGEPSGHGTLHHELWEEFLALPQVSVYVTENGRELRAREQQGDIFMDVALATLDERDDDDGA